MKTVTQSMTVTGMKSNAPMYRDAMMSFDVTTSSSSAVTTLTFVVAADVTWLDDVIGDVNGTADDGPAEPVRTTVKI